MRLNSTMCQLFKRYSKERLITVITETISRVSSRREAEIKNTPAQLNAICTSNPITGGKGWLGFPDLWSGQKPRWNWYLTSVVNFGEVRGAQLAKFTRPTFTLLPLGSFQILRSVQMLKSGVRKATGSYRTYLSLVKLQPGFLSLRWKTCLWQNCSLGSCTCSEVPALGQNTHDI